MSNKTEFNFWELINSPENMSVLIPRIQRDYIQYRGGRTKGNIKRFIRNLVSSLEEKNRHIVLNFIYGNSRDKTIGTNETINAYVPLDGQQRLTTLFLLYYYIFAQAGDGKRLDALKNKLIYETRKTTLAFINKLIDKRPAFLSEEEPKVVIRESGWFSAFWDYDVSVLSSLEVLDIIHDHLKNKTEDEFKCLADLITGSECPITFMLLDSKNIGSPSGLYIKMNSRGKQLTAFENFKAELYSYMKKKESKFTDLQGFKQKVDGAWINLIWKSIEKEAYREAFTDVFFRELIHWIFINRFYVIDKNESVPHNMLDELMYSDNVELLTLEDYLNISENGVEDAVKDLYCFLDLLCELNDSKVNQQLFCFSENEKKKTISSTVGSSYANLAMLFAITEYARRKHKDGIQDKDNFYAFFRVIKNFIQNSQIDSYKNYIIAVKEIFKFKNMTDIADYLCTLKTPEKDVLKLPALNEKQKAEEILKQKIIRNSQFSGWKNEIINAEQHSYFSGEIMFSLKLSGINDYKDATVQNCREFGNIWKKLKEIFPDNDKRNDVLLHRVLLTYGNYSENISFYDNDDYLISFYFNDKNHNQDWRGLLRSDKGFKLFKNMFDEFVNSNQSFEEFANEKCNNYSVADEELLTLLIKNKELFEYINAYNRCWYKSGEYRLLKGSGRRNYIELKLYYAYLLLKNKNKEVKYYEGNSDTESKIAVEGIDYFSTDICQYNTVSEFVESIG